MSGPGDPTFGMPGDQHNKGVQWFFVYTFLQATVPGTDICIIHLNWVEWNNLQYRAQPSLCDHFSVYTGTGARSGYAGHTIHLYVVE